MAMDGSFNLEFSFNRFLARCPELSRWPRFDYLTKKGESMTEEEVVSLLGDVFVHPDYTIPLIGCFRPLARKIVKKVLSLLRLVPNLRSNSESNLEEVDEKKILEVIDISDGNLFESFLRNGRGLNLHELACLAFCRALDLAPFLMGSILDYFKFAPAPFERIIKKDAEIELPMKGGDDLLRALRISYRILLMSSETFSKLWDWSCFLDLARKFMDVSNCTKLEYGAADIRWCTTQIIRVIFKLTDTDSMNFGIQPKEAFECLMRWQEFCCDVCLEKAGVYIVSTEEIKSEGVVHFSQSNFLESSPVHSRVSPFSDDEPSPLSQRLATWNERSVTVPFVLTLAVRRSFEMVLLAASQKWPVLLYGPPGVGKSALIKKLAQDSGNNVLSIHMDDQIDGKTLVGSYVCAEQPGEFKWQPGSLTQAVMNGYWVVFEDIDKAPADVHSIILPLLEGASSFLTGHGEEIRVADSFRLFSTVSTPRLHTGGSNGPGNLWRRVMIGQSNRKDLEDIVTTWFPSLKSLANKLIETFERINFVSGQCFIGDNAVSSSSGRFSLRDLLKWCKRIEGLGFDLMEDSLSTYVCHCIYVEAVDIFAAFSTTAESRLAIRKDIAKIWAVPIAEAGTSYPAHKPVIQDLPSEIRIGRISLPCARAWLHDQKKPFVEIRRSLHAIERIACSIKYNEPVLLVGETGTGKTTLVQNLALRLGQRLTVLNLSQQSDIADLLGGFKPMSAQYVCIPLYQEFEDLFSKTFSMKVNADFLVCLRKHVSDKNWKVLLNGMNKGVKFFHKTMEAGVCKPGEKRKKTLNEGTIEAWENFSFKLKAARRQIGSAGMVFSFVEGAFINALRNGEWILLDEVNLAPPEILQRVSAVLEGDQGSLCLAERGDATNIKRHPNFRIFACMNPATDAGKRELPYSVRSRFTEYFIDDVLDDDDLALFINRFVGDSPAKAELVKKITRFYKAARKDSDECLQDGANQKPQYSLRSLYRALEFTRKARQSFTFEKALYDGFCLFFLNLLDRPSAEIMNRKIISYLLGDIQEKGRMPPNLPFDSYITVGANSGKDDFMENYVLTKSVSKQLQNVARAVFIKKYPVLLQGPTSSGKTSLVRYLAALTGHEFVRINNHEHTDLQEYLGSYITDASGKLVFNEGALVRAVRNGSWIVLDELNLAPSDVLEALNRLLDDNREIFVPELQETVRAHPDFMLFATQNPPTVYGGRKMLSRAFRNRFVEIHVDEIPEEELSSILENRCKISGTYAKKMVEVMKDLQLHRQNSNVFAGKHGFITPRDLFRWANRVRKANSDGLSSAKKHRYEDLAREGYYLLAERLRDEGEKNVVKEILWHHFHVPLNEDIYQQESSDIKPDIDFDNTEDSESFRNIVWTRSMQRLYFLIKRCYEMREPVLLVGETGGGKTTVCQMLSIVLKSQLHILNCHQYTETSDFIGGFYPVRERSRLVSEFRALVEDLMLAKAFVNYPGSLSISYDIGQASSTLDQLSKIIDSYRKGLVSSPEVSLQELDSFEQRKRDLEQIQQRWQSIFTWQGGPLVESMKAGHLFLVDEISLADDSVLERLNSVLEPERTLSLPEKGGPALEKIVAHKNFFILATMNPGGDYGKKELSPALRNRFTEIWVPPVGDVNELRSIAMQRVSDQELSYVVDTIAKFWEWFNKLETGRTLTVRDILSWVTFVDTTGRILGAEYSLFHGLFLTLLDGLSLGTGISKSEAEELKERSLKFLEHLEVGNKSLDYLHISRMENYGWGDAKSVIAVPMKDMLGYGNVFGIDPFYIEKGNENCEAGGFELLAPTTRGNALRVLRAMQLKKPVLLEGSPGVGKTSLVVALGRFSGHKVVRINLSEQTDMMDLLGSDLPVDSDEGIAFAWSDGILLQALKEGCWVLLDELNLAPQSVLEGLNSILDHRAEVFIPELGQTYRCPPSFRVFACQNPSSQGGGRKGLPKSFLNRFTKVYVDELVEDDYVTICSSLYPSIPRPLLSKLIIFNKGIFEETMLLRKFAQDGSPWEFNLRDVIRSCQIITDAPENSKVDCFLNLLYVQRMRTTADRRQVLQLYQQVFEKKPYINPFPRVQLTSQYLIVGSTSIKRNNIASSSVSDTELKILPGIRQNLEAVASCVKYQWLCILIGPSSSGKTSLIRILSHLTCNVLHELNLSSATDISELLGCFEQYSVFRHFRSVVTQIGRYVSEYCRLHLEHSAREFIDEKKDLISKWNSFLASFDLDDVSGSSSMLMNNWGRVAGSFNLLIEIIVQLKLVMDRNVIPVSWSREEVDKIMSRILKLQEVHERTPFSAKFEWVTGLLIRAIEKGEWIVLEDANLCNPTVLDRINSLVETRGSITVNECGTIDGKPIVLHPHPNFRMFLTVNPCYGEVSRAMRNRGVEIYMMQPFWQFEGRGYEIAEMELNDVKRFLIQSGIPGASLVDSMAKAHMYVHNEGLRLNVSISYLELARWVQLFQQLATSGNSPLWSLRVSWEHTYLSSFGDMEGEGVIAHAIKTYLSENAFSKSGSLVSPLCLPGGWPTPLKLLDFNFYPRAASIKQNCMYLEFLGARCALYEVQKNALIQPLLLAQSKEPLVQNRFPVDKPFRTGIHAVAYWMDMEMLSPIIFPKDTMLQHSSKTPIDLNLANKMLLFAADWSVEQATYTDLDLYIVWFSWFSSQLVPFCEIFSSFLASLKNELNHPIWKYIKSVMLKSFCQVHMDLQKRPMLSPELVDLVASNEDDRRCGTFLCNAVNCVGLLRHSNRQWNAEESGLHGDYQNFQPLLNSLRVLEEQVLEMLVESANFNHLFKLYNCLLEDHIEFWDSVTSSQFDRLLVFWRALIKDAKKLLPFCPQAASTLTILEESRNAVGISSWQLYSEKSLLWVNGGHPSLPHAADVYNKQLNFFKLCNSIWPPVADLWRSCDEWRVELIAMLNTELRNLAVQGICIASHLSGLSIDDHGIVVQRLEEMHQMLKERFEHEKRKVEIHLSCKEDMVFEADAPSLSQILCTGSDFASWLEVLYLNDCTSFFLDTDLLQNASSSILLDPNEFRVAFSSMSHLVKFSLEYSLNSTLRPPQMFSAHQKLLWILDAWTSLDQVNARIAAFVLEMWFRWHSSLWDLCPMSLRKALKPEGLDASLPDVIFRSTRTMLTLGIEQSSCDIKDYSAYCLKLRVASSNIWQASAPETSLSDFLLSAARALLQQIIYAHHQSFDVDTFIEVKSIFSSLHENTDTTASIAILRLRSLILLSSHEGLRNSLQIFIEPALKELYLHCLPNGFNYNLGLAWLHIGSLRCHLLHSSDDLDPALKYSCKKLQLERRCSLLELEIKVREECNYLAGRFSAREPEQRRELLETLKSECNKIKRKIVFRADPKKFKKLKGEIHNVVEQASLLMLLVVNKTTNFPQVASNWQKTATSFIERLAVEYAEYVDIIQPIQVALFEMKLGLSLVLSSILEKDVSDTLVEKDMGRVMDVIYSFMRFPRSGPRKLVDVNCSCILQEVSTYNIKMPTSFSSLDVKLLEELAQRSAHSEDKLVSELQLKLAVHHNILIQTAHCVGNAHAMSQESFSLLDETFNAFAKVWLDMKIQTKKREDLASQQFRFKPRGFEMENVIEVDISTLRGSSASESFQEWQKLEAGEESTERIKTAAVGDSSEGFWDIMQDPVVFSIVRIHNQLFGSSNLILPPKTFEESDMNKLQSFLESYKLGAGMINGFWSLHSASLDSRLMPEHLLHLCLNHQQISSHTSALGHNFYKHSNASVMSQMVKFLVSLERHVLSLLNEWEDHLDLQKILDVIRMLLAIPLDTPLAKALSGLQFLINKVHEIQESGSKFSLSDQLEPIVGLAASWHKLESESWLTLLDEVQQQYETNAAKLWFPLYVLLNRPAVTTGNSEHDQSTIQSLEELIQTSNIGEFRKRLQLLLAFAGQISCGLQLGIYSSSHHVENLKILCNSFGFYLQFLPIIVEHIENNRKTIEKEIRELTKLCKWQRVESYLSMENTRRFRQKFRKLVQKYSDVLEQPLKAVLNQKSAQHGLDPQFLLSPKFLCVLATGNDKMMLELTESYKKDKFVWYANWRKKASEVAENLQPLAESAELPCLEFSEEVKSTVRRCSVAQSLCAWYQGEWEELWSALGNICTNIVGCGELWEKVDGVGKKTALSNLLKLLESHGLLKHLSALMEDQNELSWLLQPAHNMWHLLPMPAGAACVSSPCKSNCSLYDTMDGEWKTANEYYYKSIVSMQLLQQICLMFHKDFTLEQVTRSVSFLFHLLVVQQEQRDSLYDLAARLKHLHKCTSALGNMYTSSECIIADNQHMTLQCLWRQKQLFDGLLAILHEGRLLLKQVENKAYHSVLNESNRIFDFNILIPEIQQAKEELDNYLLDHDDYITILNNSLYGCIISSEMEEKAYQNFRVLKKLKKDVAAFRSKNVGRVLVRDTLLDNLDDILSKGEIVSEQFKSSFRKPREATTCLNSEVEADFYAAFKAAAGHALCTVQKLASLNCDSLSDQPCRNITSWKMLLNSCMADLELKELSDSALKMLCLAEKLVNHIGTENPGIRVQLGASFREYHSMLVLILDFGNGLLKDLLSFHKMISVMTHTLAENLSLLFSKGFGTAVEEQLDDHSQTANGTGLGAGAGIKDVSDQIENEDQLLGYDDKLDGEQDAASELPSKNEKGIEMEQDFDADMFSVSEDSAEDDNDNEESDAQQIESEMGEAGGDSEIIDEKLWNKHDSEDGEKTNEKYESGPSVKDNGDSDREFRAKEEEDATKCEEPETVSDGSDVLNNGNRNEDDVGDQDDEEEIGMDKEEAHTNPSGLEPNQFNRLSEEDAETMNDGEDRDAMEEDGSISDNDGSADGNQEDGIQNIDDNMEEAEIKESPKDPDRDDVFGANKDDLEMDLTTENDLTKQGGSSPSSDHVPASESETKLKGDSGHSNSVNDIPEANWSSSGNAENDLAPLSGQPSSTQPSAEFMVLDSSYDGKLADHGPKPQLPLPDSSPFLKGQPNPYRSVGDALEGWKERIQLSIDLPENKGDEKTEVDDENADEYGYVTQHEKGTAQALGPATSEQMDHQFNSENSESVTPGINREELTERETDLPNQEANRASSSTTLLRDRPLEPKAAKNLEKSPDNRAPRSEDLNENYQGKQLESLVHVRSSSPSSETLQLSRISISADESGIAQEHKDISGVAKDITTSLWRKYELRTTRLSQELAEQLRLVLEPTLASKLQGDYKTGKRINMKKVIPYIASHYRKDKIWLRRTRPDKRDYQVVIAIDDSRSMSESGCGNVAVEALVTVCRALSQLEMRNLAIASFGKMGNIRLLHDFDRPFTREAGIEMISSLTFKQENTVADEPVVDLLKHLKKMLDVSVLKARLPSGHNPLQQLVLIIADGRFHEKELKRCVRDFLNSKRMVAFLLLDNPEESIMDLMEASFQGENIKFSKYLDSFPFPYYIVLKNIEALPRTLSDLLRQWFELMQYSRD